MSGKFVRYENQAGYQGLKMCLFGPYLKQTGGVKFKLIFEKCFLESFWAMGLSLLWKYKQAGGQYTVVIFGSFIWHLAIQLLILFKIFYISRSSLFLKKSSLFIISSIMLLGLSFIILNIVSILVLWSEFNDLNLWNFCGSNSVFFSFLLVLPRGV